jgi:hypothetical protein
MHFFFDKKTFFLYIIALYFILDPLNVLALNIEPIQIEKKVIVKANFGSKKGEIGKAPIDPEDQTYGGSINPIAVDSKGNIYIGDSVNHRIQKFDSKGNFLSEVKLNEIAWPIINDIAIDKNDNIFVAFNHDTRIRKFASTGMLISIIDLSDAGTLEIDKSGKVRLDEKGIFSINRLLVDNNGNIYVLFSNENLLKLNNKGKIIQRWPKATNAMNFLFIDEHDNLYIWDWISPYKRYDKNGNFIGTGLGIYENIVIPFYSDKYGNVYGFAPHPDNSLVVYTIKGNKLFKFPIKYDDLFDEWTVDSEGNIYDIYTGMGDFRVIKVSIVSESNK